MDHTAVDALWAHCLAQPPVVMNWSEGMRRRRDAKALQREQYQRETAFGQAVLRGDLRAAQALATDAMPLPRGGAHQALGVPRLSKDSSALDWALASGQLPMVQWVLEQGALTSADTIDVLLRQGNPALLTALLHHRQQPVTQATLNFKVPMGQWHEKILASEQPALIKAWLEDPTALAQATWPKASAMHANDTQVCSAILDQPELVERLMHQWGVTEVGTTRFAQAQRRRGLDAKTQAHVMRAIWEPAVQNDDVAMARQLVQAGWAPLDLLPHPLGAERHRKVGLSEGMLAHWVQRRAFELLAWAMTAAPWKEGFLRACDQEPALWWKVPVKGRVERGKPGGNLQEDPIFWEQLAGMGFNLMAQDENGETVVHALALGWAFGNALSQTQKEAVQWWQTHYPGALHQPNHQGQTPLALTAVNPVVHATLSSMLLSKTMAEHEAPESPKPRRPRL